MTADLLHRIAHDPGWHVLYAALVFELGLALTVISLTTRSTR